jgi:hypothetical protein
MTTHTSTTARASAEITRFIGSDVDKNDLGINDSQKQPGRKVKNSRSYIIKHIVEKSEIPCRHVCRVRGHRRL